MCGTAGLGTLASVRAPVERPVASWFWALAPLYSLGFATAAVMGHAAVKKRSWLQGLSLPIYVAGLLLVLLFDPDDGSRQDFLFGLGMTVNMGLGLVHSITARRWVFSGNPAPDPRGVELRHRQALAIAAHQDHSAARAEAHRIVATDPQLARGLVIGRPDLPYREFPDGGVVDVNQATVGMLCHFAGLPDEVSRRIVEVRTQVGEFASYDDLLVTADLDPYVTDRVRDWLVFIPRAAGAPSSRGSRPR